MTRFDVLKRTLLAAAACLITSLAMAEDMPGGQLNAMLDGQQIALPLLNTRIDAKIAGDLANVTVRQVFENPTDVPLNATYLFPLNKGAAVHAMTMQVGTEIITAVIQEKKQAQATFDAAASEGKAAALLVQHRPNMFTQNVANLMPGLPVTVTMTYAQTVPRIDGAYELVVPLVTGPRYEGATDAKLPAYPGVAGLDLPETIAQDRVSIRTSLTAPVPITAIYSATHSIDVSGEDTRTIRLSEGKTIDNRDFVLRYDLAGDAVQAGALTHLDDRGGIVSLMIEPPALPDQDQILPRELVIVLDTSGSMAGAPLEASKAFMQHALEGLRPGDYFRIIRFSNTAEAYAQQAQPATPESVRQASAFVERLNASGGTEIDNAIRSAFAAPQPDGILRVVVFLSDGYIGNEAQVLGTIDRLIGKSRIYALGVGTSVNRYLLDEMARVGRGFARYVDPTETGLDAARTLAIRLESPLLTDLSIDWGDADITQQTPAILPDLFAGDTVRVLARFAGTGRHPITVNAMAQDRSVTLPIVLDLPAEATEGTGALPLIWARSTIADLMRQRAIASGSAKVDAQLREQITDLGLTYSMITEWTSFVAVSHAIVSDNPGGTPTAAVPLPKVLGVEATAYPSGVTGSSTPEAPELAGLLVLTLLFGFWLYNRQKETV